MTAEIHPLRTERELDAAHLAEKFATSAGEIHEYRKADITGYAIVAWSDRGDATCHAVVGRHSTVLPALVPTFVAESIRTDLVMRHTLSAIAAAKESGDSAS